MSESSSPSGSPSAAQAAPVNTSAAPAASSSTVQTDINAQVKTATSPADLRKLATQLRENPNVRLQKPATQQQTAPATTPAASAPAVQETPAEETAPAATEETPAEEAQPAETPEEQPEAEQASDAQPEEDDGGDGPVTPLTGKRSHLRLNDADEVGRLALAYQKRNKDWTLEQALEAAKRQLGVTPQSAAPEKAAPPQLPQTVEEVESATQQKLADYKKAMAEVRFEDAADIQAELIKLSLHRSTLERRAEQEQSRAEQEYHKKYDASEARAAEMYPFAADPKSPGCKRMLEIEKALKENDDPLYYSPDKPLRIAQMAAAELNIAPKSKTPPAKPAAAPAPAAPKKGMVPSGSSRATPPPANQPPPIDAKIKAVKNPYELQQLRKELGLPA